MPRVMMWKGGQIVSSKVILYNKLHMTAGYTKKDLRQLAADRGHPKVSDVQLSRWHRIGLLPKPKRRSLGKGHGTEEAIYPSQTADQLLHLLELRKEKHERRHLHLAWYQWWDGYDVPMPLVREFLKLVAGQWDANWTKLKEKTPEELRDLLEAEMDPKRRVSGDEKLLNPFRRRVGRDQFTDLGVTLLLLVRSDSNVEPGMEHIAEGCFKVLFDKQILDKKLLSNSYAVMLLLAVRGALSVPFSKRLELLSDDELCQGRDLFKMIFEVARGFEVVIAQLIGGKTARSEKTAWNLVNVFLSARAKSQALWLLIVATVLAEKLLTEPSDGALAVASAQPSLELLKLLINEVPMLTEDGTLATRRLNAALRDETEMERLLSEVQGIAKYDPVEFEQFLINHPEYTQALHPEQEGTSK